ncbi:MAG: 3-phosphoshikimate 1-carboxyvinyltransferase, partial [Candidatus Thorarchaeota archaeon AB_25]
MIQLPSAVIRTRGLLNLRSFSVDEVLEYDDKYVMYPTRDVQGEIQKYAIWMLKDPKVVGVAYVKDLAREMEETDSHRGMLVGGLRFTPAAKKMALISRVELVDGGYASFDLFEHELVPTHIIASEEEIQLVLDHYGISIDTEDDFSSFAIPGGQSYKKATYQVEGDWSGAAFLLVAGAIAGKVTVNNLPLSTLQGDKKILEALEAAGARLTIAENSVTVEKKRLQAFEFDADECPDLFPPLAVLACYCSGQSLITGVDRLR